MKVFKPWKGLDSSLDEDALGTNLTCLTSLYPNTSRTITIRPIVQSICMKHCLWSSPSELAAIYTASAVLLRYDQYTRSL